MKKVNGVAVWLGPTLMVLRPQTLWRANRQAEQPERNVVTIVSDHQQACFAIMSSSGMRGAGQLYPDRVDLSIMTMVIKLSF